MIKSKGITLITFVITILAVSLACLAFQATRWIAIAYLAVVIYFFPMLLVVFVVLVGLYFIFVEEFDKK